MIRPGTMVGNIRIGEPLGRGGMGAVYLGFDQKLQREVAVKAIRSDRLAPGSKARILREARILSRLDDPRICSIYDYVEGEEQDFLILELIGGRSLKQALAEGLDEGTRLIIAEEISRALVVAHSIGVIHRDLKPENVMLTASGEVKVLDFGIARSADRASPGTEEAQGSFAAHQPEETFDTRDQETLAFNVPPPPPASIGPSLPEKPTDKGIVVGTPGYMSPEQARGEAVAAASDIYAAGLLLQEIFTGEKAFDATRSFSALVLQATRGVSRPVRGVDAEITQLIERCKLMAPEARPAASELVERLRWIRNRPRRRLRRLLVTAVFLGLVAALAVVSVFWRQSLADARRAEAAKLLALGQLALEKNRTAALAYGTASLEIWDSPEARRLALAALWDGPTARFLTTTDEWTWGVDFSPDGQRLAVGHLEPKITLWPANGGSPEQLTCDLDAERNVFLVRFAQEPGFLLAASGTGTTARIWSLTDGRLHRRLDLGDRSQFFNSDQGTLAVSFDRLRERAVWRRWPTVDDQPELLGEQSVPYSFPDVHNSGRWVLSPLGKDLRLVDLDHLIDGSPRLIGTHDALIEKVACRPGSLEVASIDSRGEIRLWDTTSSALEPRRVMLARPDPTRIAFDPAGTTLASTHGGGGALLWQLDLPQDADPVELDLPVQMNCLVFHPQRPWVATTSVGGAALWPVGRPRSLVLRGHTEVVSDLVFSADGSLLVSASWDGSIRLWPMHGSGDQCSRSLLDPEDVLGDLVTVATDAAGNFAVAGGAAGRLRLVQTAGSTGRARALEGFHSLVQAVAVSPSGGLIAAGGGLYERTEAVVRVWDLQNNSEMVLDAADGEAITGLDFATDERLLVASGGNLRQWNLGDGNRSVLVTDGVQAFDLSPAAGTLAFLRNGRLLVRPMASDDESRLQLHGAGLKNLAIDADGRAVVSAAEDGTIRVGPTNGTRVHLLLGHHGAVHTVAISPDGQWVASGGDDGTVRLWPMPLGEPFHELPYDELLRRLRTVTNLRVRADASSTTGYDLATAPFPGWLDRPAW